MFPSENISGWYDYMTVRKSLLHLKESKEKAESSVKNDFARYPA